MISYDYIYDKKGNIIGTRMPEDFLKDENPVFDIKKAENEYREIQKETEALLRTLYPGQRVKVGISEILRSPEKQEKALHSGHSRSSISLHNFGAAADYTITIGGKKYGQTKNDPTHSRDITPFKVLGHVAKKHGKFWGWGWDSGHIGETRFVDQFVRKYPDQKDNPTLKHWYEENKDRTKLGYKPLMGLLDTLYNTFNENRIYTGEARTIDPLLDSYDFGKNEEVFKYINK